MSDIREHQFSQSNEFVEKANRSFLDRFIHRVGTSFGLFKPQTCEKLAGRIRVMQKTATDMVEKLRAVQKELEQAVDEELYGHIQDVIRPLIREIEKVNLTNKEYKSVTEQALAFRRYSEWVERAKEWLQVWNQSQDREALAKAVAEHIIEEVFHSIERDICLIVDYKRHVVGELSLGESKKKMIRQRLGRTLKPIFNSLKALEKRPTDPELRAVAAWRGKVNQERQQFHEHALSLVDQIVHQYQKGAVSREDHDHLVEVLQQLIYLEEAVPHLIEDEKDNQEEWLSRLNSLEQEAYHLNLDLRLPVELVERLHVIIDRLELLREDS